ncbi:hypothetical protein GCM10008934_41900 [Virgibacillus salarius]
MLPVAGNLANSFDMFTFVPSCMYKQGNNSNTMHVKILKEEKVCQFLITLIRGKVSLQISLIKHKSKG